jgi:transcriptional antiterminator NusG
MIAEALSAEDLSAPAGAWYAVWTRSRQENVVSKQLVQREIETFLPRVTRWSRWRDRRKRIEWPLFPGYCFVRFDGLNTLPILKCTGVLGIVSFEGKPAPIEDVELNNLRVLVGTTFAYDPCPLIREGALVEITHGPLTGVTGRLLRKDAHRAAVVLSVDLIKQAVRVEVAAADIRLVSHTPPHPRIA